MSEWKKGRVIITKKKNFTFIEFLVVINIILIPPAMLLPALNRAREAAKKTQCINNLKQANLFLLDYESENDDYIYPQQYLNATNGRYWFTYMIREQAKKDKYADSIVDCPGNLDKYSDYELNYGLNEKFSSEAAPYTPMKIHKIPKMSVLIGETSGRYLVDAGFGDYFQRYFKPGTDAAVLNFALKTPHSNSANLLFEDGHVANKKRGELEKTEFTGN